MKNLKNIIIEKLCHQQVDEKLIINKNSKLAYSLDTSDAEKFNSPKELLKWRPDAFDNQIVSFISGFITIRPFYAWEMTIGEEDHKKFIEMQTNHLEKLGFSNLPQSQIHTDSIGHNGIMAYGNILDNKKDKYIIINIIYNKTTKVITLLQK